LAHKIGINEGGKMLLGNAVNHQSFLAYCQYDYRLAFRDPTDNALSANLAKADFGGPIADELYRAANGIATPDAIGQAWDADLMTARDRFSNPLGQTLSDLHEAIQDRFGESPIWAAVLRIAEKLCDEGAISGKTAKSLFTIG
jgi:hypothetical protein